MTSHHPPVLHYHVIGPDECYVATGHYEAIAGINGPNSFYGARKGKNIIKLKDGTIYSIVNPKM
jgi:hypothetical protein